MFASGPRVPVIKKFDPSWNSVEYPCSNIWSLHCICMQRHQIPDPYCWWRKILESDASGRETQRELSLLPLMYAMSITKNCYDTHTHTDSTRKLYTWMFRLSSIHVLEHREEEKRSRRSRRTRKRTRRRGGGEEEEGLSLMHRQGHSVHEIVACQAKTPWICRRLVNGRVDAEGRWRIYVKRLIASVIHFPCGFQKRSSSSRKDCGHLLFGIRRSIHPLVLCSEITAPENLTNVEV